MKVSIDGLGLPNLERSVRATEQESDLIPVWGERLQLQDGSANLDHLAMQSSKQLVGSEHWRATPALALSLILN